ncbi:MULTISPECIES: hypothetical protein [unclassified Chryseobacterium]|uniref:hypothetical protein n=1 Tax=unclassified Chryseobacterium TaxID=2593645 RepID=UPI001AEB25CD|nr:MULTISPECIES: hypothetical protein [unclassified Chryseobacterium]MBP1164559.1 hypothetical protein [Chryseobacterium sp. PvR013]
MEHIIIIGLIIVIVLIVLDKKPKTYIEKSKDKSTRDFPSIMGNTKKDTKDINLFSAVERPIHYNEKFSENLNSETFDEIIDNIDQRNDLNEILITMKDLEKEEEDWLYQANNGTESGFASGVTFEELTTVGKLLQQKILEPALEKDVIHIIQKVHGTELLSLLENSIENSSLKIARLLDNTYPSEAETDPFSTVNDFDIEEFI